MNNKSRRNIWLALAILSVVAILDRAVRVFTGSLEWWQLASVIIICALCTRFYLCYRRALKDGNLYGHVRFTRK